MIKRLKVMLLALFSLCIFAGSSPAQKKPATVCRQSVFEARQQLPELTYDCPESATDSDDKILKLPSRIKAIAGLTKELESLTAAAWWQADVDELAACDVHDKPGALTAEEKQKLSGGEYTYLFSGNHQFRLVITYDPCYQTGYNGSILFLLYRKGGKVFVAKLRDDYYSRLENSVGIDFANLNGRQIIEISTANTMTPTATNYYYEIDPTTNQALPRNLFKQGGKLTNEISSAIIIGEPSEIGLPKNSKDMTIIHRNRLAPTFNTYAEDYGNESSGQHMLRTVFRWNGRYYVSSRSNKKTRPN
jgi:hypothetical protein